MNQPISPGKAAEDQTGRFVTQPNGRVRPLSPHLQIWRWHTTMAASILTRATGGALYAGAILVGIWLLALALGPEAYGAFTDLAGSPLGLLVWIGFSFALFAHLALGVRNLIFDAGAGLSPKGATALAWWSFGFGLVATAVFWIALFAFGRVAL